MKKISKLLFLVLALTSCSSKFDDGTVKCQELFDVSFKLEYSQSEGYFTKIEYKGERYATNFTKLWAGCWYIPGDGEAINYGSDQYSEFESILAELSNKDVVYGVAKYDYERPGKYDWSIGGYQTILIKTIYTTPEAYTDKTIVWWC